MSTQPIAAEVDEYLAAVDDERGEALREVFDVVHEAIPPGYELGMYWGMPGWVVPMDRFADTYNGEPLNYVSLAAQKRYLSLYLLGPYSDPEEDAAFRAAWAATGLKLDMGKSCLRFTRLENVDLGLIAQTVAATSVDDFVAKYQRLRG